MTTPAKRTRTKKAQAPRYADLRPHAARVVRLAEYPMHVNGGYLDDPNHIPVFRAKDKA